MGLTLSEEKTKITHITEGFQFLGYRIERSMGEKGVMAHKVRIPEDAMKRLRHAIREITAPNTTDDAVSAKITALNAVTRGWCQYYSCTSNPSIAFGKLSPELYWGLAHWLGRKYQLNMPAVLQKYQHGKTPGTSKVKLLMPSDFKARKRLIRKWHNPYTETGQVREAKDRLKREQLFSWDRLWHGEADRHGWMDLREEVMQRKGTTCHRCGEVLYYSEVGIDHVTPRAGFKDTREADRMKHLQPICTSCHRTKTKSDLKVLSRMR